LLAIVFAVSGDRSQGLSQLLFYWAKLGLRLRLQLPQLAACQAAAPSPASHSAPLGLCSNRASTSASCCSISVISSAVSAASTARVSDFAAASRASVSARLWRSRSDRDNIEASSADCSASASFRGVGFHRGGLLGCGCVSRCVILRFRVGASIGQGAFAVFHLIIGLIDAAPRLLASQAEDHVTLWDLDECADNDARGDPVEGRQRIATGARVANSLAFLSDARFLALVYTRRVLLLRLNSTVRDQDAAGIWLDGHSAQVNLAIDLPDDRLLTISDDRTFQLWRLGSGDDGIEDDEDKEGHHCAQLLHRSAVLGPAALTAAALAESDLLYLGSAAGRLTVVGLGDDGDYRELARSSLAAGQLEAAAAGSGPALSPESAAAVAALALT
uniref:WD_REPEATS_REGION domain-containing protein n=1 Tax=Macrostomum lignano TaxID=282301 RepID=A0A1I8IPI9_9PLAT